MRRTLIAVVALAVLLAACSGSDAGGVASLEDSDAPGAEPQASEESFEETVLAFSACMRENGVEDFEDPDFNADGSLSLRGEFRQSSADQETIQAAFEACRSHLEGIAFGRGSVDITEIEDRLVEFAACMRDNGFDMPDPDFSSFGQGGDGPGGGGPFGEDFDPEDPAFQAALEACEDVFEGFRIGGPGDDGGGG